MITGIISITVGAVILSSVFMTTLKGTNQSSICYNATGDANTCAWSTSEIAMWGLLSLIGVVGLLYGVLSVFGIA